MSDAYRARSVTVDGGPTALGSAGSLSVVFDRPASAGGRGLGFSGSQLLRGTTAVSIRRVGRGGST